MTFSENSEFISHLNWDINKEKNSVAEISLLIFKIIGGRKERLYFPFCSEALCSWGVCEKVHLHECQWDSVKSKITGYYYYNSDGYAKKHHLLDLCLLISTYPCLVCDSDLFPTCNSDKHAFFSLSVWSPTHQARLMWKEGSYNK